MNSHIEFMGSRVLVTGGTGSFGQTMVNHLLTTGVEEIRVLSRDENKQDSLRRYLDNERVRYLIGDVRDRDSVERATKNVDYVFHAAALKQVPSCEFFPSEAIKTNILGSENVIRSGIKWGVKSIVCLSTDKAVYPINAMGMSKALMERVAQSFARDIANEGSRIVVTRYGNVMMSRGSVIPLFRDQIRSGVPITLTDSTMTRFLMSLQDSVDLVKFAFLHASSGDVVVKKAAACTIQILVEAIKELEGAPNHPVRVIGSRHGEKKHEVLVSSEEMLFAIDESDYYQIPIDSRGLHYQTYFSQGKLTDIEPSEFSSRNTRQLNKDEVMNLIAGLPEYGIQR